MAEYGDVDYFEEASSSIELVQQLVSHQVQLNLFQCQYLSSKLAEAGSFLKAKSYTLRAVVDRNDIRRKALLMLHFAVKRAEKLVRNCCCERESWLESAMTLAQIKEDIVDILLDLRWWTSMVDIAIASVTWMSTGRQIELELLKCAEEDFQSLLKQLQFPSNELDDAATKDKNELLKRLRDVQASCGGRNGDPQQKHEYLLATHVRSLLENRVFEAMGDADLNAYEDSKFIGQGGFGAVMDVRWLGRRCALKILQYKCTKEATSLSAFQHPHIVQFFRYWEAPIGATRSEQPYSTPREDTPYSTPYGTPLHSTQNDATRSDTSMIPHPLKDLQSHILMELLPTDLAAHLRDLINAMKVRVGSKRRSEPSPELPIADDVAIDVMLQIVKAMWHLNSKDVAHRDLNPSNVLVRFVSKDEVPELNARGYLRVKLGDFGLAKTKAYSQVSSKQTTMVGTKIYGAPEVFSTEVFSEKKFPRRADVWSFGIMFNQVLSGRQPLEGTDGRVGELQSRIRKGWRPALPENCPDYLKFCITSCWELRPQHRPNFTDLWKMVRFAQVRSLGLIRENHDLFTYQAQDSVRRLHSIRRTPPPVSPPFVDNKGNLKSNSIWLFIWRITYLLMRRREPSKQINHPLRQGTTIGGSSSRSEDKPLGFLVNAVWPLESTSETMLDVIFFEGNVGRRKHLSCKDTWVQRFKPDVWWPRDWLPKDLRGDVRVLLLEYSISEAGVEGVVDELQRLLVFSDRWNRGHTWQRPVVLVGHSLGCIVIEQLVVALGKRAKSIEILKDEMETARAKVSRAFLASLAGCFFYAPPLKGLVPSEDLLKHVFGGLSYSRDLFADLCLDSTKLKEVSEEFMQIRGEGVQLMALIEGFHTRGRTVVPPASMEGFAGEVVELAESNHSDACKPTNKEHPAYRKLVEFIRAILDLKKTDIEYEMASISIGPMKMDRLQKEPHRAPGVDLAIASKKRSPYIFLIASNHDTVFAEQLSADLERANQSPVADKHLHGVPMGDGIIPHSSTGTQDCELVVVVLSEEYFTRSKWKMLALVSIVKSIEHTSRNMEILPLFYGLSCVEFKNLKRRELWFLVWKEWAKSDNRISLDDWMHVLRELDKRNGMEYLRANGEVSYRKEIVTTVVDMLQRRSQEVVIEPAPNFQFVDVPAPLQELPRHFFGNQCKVLKVQLLIAEEILNTEKSQNGISSADGCWPQLALTELRRVVKLGKSLIQDCRHDELCLKAYLRQGARTQEFAETLKEIVWCMSVVRLYKSSGYAYFIQNPSLVMDEFSQARLGPEVLYLLQKAAIDDQNELQAALAIWIQNHSCSAEECGRHSSPDRADDPLTCLAAQISARMSNGEGNIIGNVEADHTTVLWITSQEVLIDGGQIGKGSFGTVFETMWLGDTYAKKEFSMVPQNFQDEANALAKLNHPYIVKVSAYSVESGTCFFLMERMADDLHAHMKTRMKAHMKTRLKTYIRHQINSPFSILASIDLMLQVSEAMCYMNSQGMVHRDLKAQNILVKPIDDPELRKEGFVIAKLADFGLAKSKHEVTSYFNVSRNVGTNRWMAPEMFKANEVDDERLLIAFPRQADVYSFGIVCSEILTGELPFQHVGIVKMGDLYKMVTDSKNPLRPKLPVNCPENLASLIRQCWEYDPMRRPTFEEISRRLRYLKGLFMVTDTKH